MRIGIHTFDFNMSEESPIKSLCQTLRERGHEVLFLDTNKAQRDGDQIVFPELPAGGKIDAFVSYLPHNDFKGLWEGRTPGEVPYFDQVRWLDAKFPSPTPYSGQLIANSKTKMATMFADIKVPIPHSYDGTDILAREKILAEIHAGKTMVFKPDFGGSGFGIIKVSTEKEAVKAFKDFDATGQPFLVQEYIAGPRDQGRAIDYRAIVVGDRVIAGIKRTAQPGEWRGNMALGAVDEPHPFTAQQEKDAIKAMRAAKLGFGAVDILIDPKTGQHYICEVNEGLNLDCLKKIRPDLNLAGEIVQMFEKNYGTGRDLGLCGQAFTTSHDHSVDKFSITSENLPVISAPPKFQKS